MMKPEDYENEIAVLHLQERLRNAEVARLTSELAGEVDTYRAMHDRVSARLRGSDAEVARLTSELASMAEKLGAALLREQEVAAEVDRQRLQIEHMRADYTSRAGLHLRAEERAERLELELAAARENEMRLLWTFIDTGIDQIGEIDIHARACEINGSEDEMKDASYLQAIREAVDAARRAGEGEA